MLYNRVKEHVVNDKKKMYKRGSQWVVVSAFAIALGGVAFTQVQPVSAATTESRLTVQPVTLTKQGQPTAASTQHEPASSIQSGQTTAQTTAAPSQAAVSQAAAPQQSVATYQDANSSTASTPTPSGMTEAEWQAQKAKYDQAKSSAAQSEAAATQKASEATASYASSLAAQSEAQTQRDQASLAAASSSATSSLAALQQQQDSSYAAASQSANAQIANLNSQRTSGEPTEQVSDGGTFDYVAEHGLWTNVVTYKDAGKTWDGKKIVTHEGSGKIWNGNYLVQNLPVFKDPNQAGLTDDLYDRRDDNQPSWSLGDTVKKNQLTDNQKSEINQYAMMLVNNYRESMGLNPVSTTQGFLNLVQQRGETLTNTNNTSHDPDIINSIFKYSDGADETIAPVDISPFTNYSESNPTMLEVMQGVAEAINGLFNYDGDSGQGHRGILLSDDIDAGFSLQYNTVQNAWVMNSNGSYKAYPGANILNVPSQTSTTPVQDNNKEIDQKIQQVKDNLQALKNTQDQQYQDAQANLRSSLQELADQFTASEAQTQKDNDSKLKVFEADQNQALATFIAELNKKVEAMNPGAKPVTPSSGASSSSASSSSASSTGSSASSS
ncbi:cell surface protein, partial [Lacticaseibacillus rhamnosus]